MSVSEVEDSNAAETQSEAATEAPDHDPKPNAPYNPDAGPGEVDKFRQAYYPDANPPTAENSKPPVDGAFIDKNYAHYPPDDEGKDADRIQFKGDHTAVIWTQDPDMPGDDKTPKYGTAGFMDQKGETHFLNDEQYGKVNSGEIKLDDIISGKVAYQQDGVRTPGAKTK